MSLRIQNVYLCIYIVNLIEQTMITNQLLRPASIVVVGDSNNVHKPGGAIFVEI